VSFGMAGTVHGRGLPGGFTGSVRCRSVASMLEACPGARLPFVASLQRSAAWACAAVSHDQTARRCGDLGWVLLALAPA
jgi:hypothetical protein